MRVMMKKKGTGSYVAPVYTTATYAFDLNDPVGAIDTYYGQYIESYDDRIMVGVDSPVSTYGSVYMYSPTGSLIKTITRTGSVGDRFGMAVHFAPEVEKLVIAASGENDNTGAVYVYDWDGSNEEFRYAPVGSKHFGWDHGIAVSGKYAAISSHTSVPQKIFVLDLLTNETAYVLEDTNGSQFGRTLRASGDYLVVGDYTYDGSQGIIYIYSISTGALLNTITNPNTNLTSTQDTFSWFGISISGNVLAVTARDEVSNVSGGLGVVHLFNITTGSRLRTIENPSVTGATPWQGFGYQHSFVGDYIIITHPGWQDTLTAEGIAYVYNIQTGELIETINNPNASKENNWFGYDVSVLGNKVFIGARGFDSNRGIVNVFELS